MKKRTPVILVLGAEGMLGQTVYKYLHKQFGPLVFGTTRKGIFPFLSFSVSSLTEDFKKIIADKGNIDYVINCIGKVTEENRIELIEVNALFPHQLEKLAKEYSFHLFHVSTDAVFSRKTSEVYEDTLPSPDSYYGASKLLGETTTKNAITIRSSFLGLDTIHNRGLLQWARNISDSHIVGYINHHWSGCTSLQFAMLCESIINKTTFQHIRSLSPVLHFEPLKKITKYKILKTFIDLEGINKRIEATHSPLTSKRILNTNFPAVLSYDKMSNSLSHELSRLLAFENEK